MGTDHPRTCGENLNKSALMYWREGSPPHLRGKQLKIYPMHFNDRITPAPAGKTRKLTLKPTVSMDHPRTCGENNWTVYKRCSGWGSPPHLRGKLKLKKSIKTATRITPAPAGKTQPIFQPYLLE